MLEATASLENKNKIIERKEDIQSSIEEERKERK